MTDQAQGLRALADHVRGDNKTSAPAAGDSTGERFLLSEAGHAVVTQAESDRRSSTNDSVLPDGLPRYRAAFRREDSAARFIAVTSGKGGVGKSNFTANLSLMLSQLGQRVIMLDADLGLANLHVLLDVVPRFSLEHVITGEKTLEEALHKGPGGVQLIAGGSGVTELANLSENVRQAFVIGLQELDHLGDVIVIDTGAGIAQNVLAFLSAVSDLGSSGEVIVLTTPEPTAITDAYATIKVVSQENPAVRLMLVVNMVNSFREGEAVGNRMVNVARQFLNINLEYLGCIPTDPAVCRAVRNNRPFVLSEPGCAASKSIANITGKMGYRRRDERPEAGINAFVSRMQQVLRFSKPGKPTSRSEDTAETAHVLLKPQVNK